MPGRPLRAARPVYVVDAVRTPLGKYGGALASVRSDDLAAHVITALTERHPQVTSRVDQVVFGATNQAGEDSRNVARMASLLAGLSHDVAAVTVNRLCGSGLEAIGAAFRMIALGEADCVIAGGVESMSRAPFVMAKSERAFSRRAPELYDTTLGWRFFNPKLASRLDPISMGETAENVAKKHGISRADQDAYALASHRRAAAATSTQRFASEIAPIALAPRRGPEGDGAPVVFDRDEGIRVDTDLDRLARLRPVFREGGTVTAGNASPLSDGSAALLLASGDVVEALGLPRRAAVLANATVGVDPNYMGEGPIGAVRKLLRRADLRVPNIDLFELNEAFAAQALACIRALELDPERVNVDGGALALGHPIGCSGARIAVTLVHALERRDASLGVATLCIGVGQGIATLFERTSN
ncbi:MAG: thiolase family protein [Myxococcota bacterium]